MLSEFALGFEGFEIVDLSFTVPLFECTESASGYGHSYSLSILWVYQPLGLEVWEEFALHLHIGVGDKLTCGRLFARDKTRFGHRSWI